MTSLVQGHNLIYNVCIFVLLLLQVPCKEEDWKRVAHNFNEAWNFPHCIGAMDGKHITIKPPPHSGSYYFTYKQTFSIVLLALVDANYRFMFVDVGTNGRVSDGGVFRNSALSNVLDTNSLNMPGPETLPAGTVPVPYVIVADDAFPLKPNIMKPYSRRNLSHDERIFNYRLSRARRIVENAFGILANRFRVFMKPIALSPENVEYVVLAACSLHNYLRGRSSARNVYLPPGIVDYEDEEHKVIHGQWRQSAAANKDCTWDGMCSQAGSCNSHDAKTVREELCRYFISANGSVSWQDNMI